MEAAYGYGCRWMVKACRQVSSQITSCLCANVRGLQVLVAAVGPALTHVNRYMYIVKECKRWLRRNTAVFACTEQRPRASTSV